MHRKLRLIADMAWRYLEAHTLYRSGHAGPTASFDRCRRTGRLEDRGSCGVEAGHAARLDDLALSKSHTIYWRMGWQDADILMMQDVSAQDVPGRSFPDRTRPQLCSLYALGRITRSNGLPFAVDSPQSWKYGWGQMDIDLGVSNPRNSC